MKKLLLLFILSLVACTAYIPVNQSTSTNNSLPIVVTIQNNSVQSNLMGSCKNNVCMNTDFYNCTTDSVGNRVLVKVGLVIGECNVSCIVTNDCKFPEECYSPGADINNYYVCKNYSYSSS